MNAVLDIGNTLTKLGKILENGEMEVNSKPHEQIGEVLNGLKIERLLVCSVRKKREIGNELFKNVVEVTYLNHKTPTPVKLRYNTPETLGMDRLAAIMGAKIAFPNENCLVIDCGTCITYDFLNNDSEYLGGAIAPGINMKFRALNTFTDQLPLTSIAKEEIKLLGNTTESCIRSGVILGTLAEIEQTIQLYQTKFGKVNVILTGGDAKYFESKINTPIFVRSNLVLEGLKGILEYNK